jgi:hypothetical protein
MKNSNDYEKVILQENFDKKEAFLLKKKLIYESKI